MRNLEEIKKYLFKVGHDQLSIQKIEGFLLGQGLLDEEFEMEYMIGEQTFDQFRCWFNGVNSIKFVKGDFIHVCEDIDVICLSDVVDNRFVGTNGCVITDFVLDKYARLCTIPERNKLENVCKAHGFKYNNNTYEFEVIDSWLSVGDDKTARELYRATKKMRDFSMELDENTPFGKWAKGVCDELIKIGENTLDEYARNNPSQYLEGLKLDSLDAIEKIFVALRKQDLNEKEEDQLVEALKVLVELGKMYE